MSLSEAYISSSIVAQVYISRWCDRLPVALTELEAVHLLLHYFRKRESLLQYPVYQQQGWPIGSGMVESANKVVVQARLKGAGMHWEPAHVNPMLALRNALRNERWEETWQLQQQRRTQDRRAQRRRRCEQRRAHLLQRLTAQIVRFCLP